MSGPYADFLLQVFSLALLVVSTQAYAPTFMGTRLPLRKVMAYENPKSMPEIMKIRQATLLPC